jgi:hypothetical protein
MSVTLCFSLSINSLIISLLLKSIIFFLIYIAISQLLHLDGQSIFWNEFGKKFYRKLFY